jgi:hypothetical protein
VSANDVRPAAKEQVASLGAKFIAVEDEEFTAAETSGGYAKAMSDEYQAKQAALTAEHIAKQDIVITTALIPGRAAPVLVTQEMVESMRPGSVIIDMAVAQGGNCPLSKPDEVVDHGGVKIAGFTNLPAQLPADSSALYARNLLAFLPLITAEDGALNLETDDEIVTAMLLTRAGETVNERLTGVMGVRLFFLIAWALVWHGPAAQAELIKRADLGGVQVLLFDAPEAADPAIFNHGDTVWTERFEPAHYARLQMDVPARIRPATNPVAAGTLLFGVDIDSGRVFLSRHSL